MLQLSALLFIHNWLWYEGALCSQAHRPWRGFAVRWRWRGRGSGVVVISLTAC